MRGTCDLDALCRQADYLYALAPTIKQNFWLEAHGGQILLYGTLLCGLVGASLAGVSGSQTTFSTLVGLGIGGVAGLFVLAAILDISEQLAEKYSPWRARCREQESSNIEEKIARGLFDWHPGIQCDGEVNYDGYCEKCGQ